MLDEWNCPDLFPTFSGLEMNRRNQVLIVNASIVLGLCFMYVRGAPIIAVVITGATLLILANIIFLLRGKRSR